MLLNYLRRKRDSLKWVLWVLIFVLGAGMLLLFVDTPTGGASGLELGEIARVGDDSIRVTEFQRNFAQLVDIYREQLGDNFEQYATQLNLPSQAVNSLISEYSIAQRARSLGFEVTDREVSERVLSMPGFKDENGNFIGLDLYERILDRNRLSVRAFEDNIRREVLRDKLQNFLISGQSIPSSSVKREFLKQEQQSRIRYVAFRPDDVVMEVTDEQLKRHFEANTDKYKLPERRGVQYLEVPIDESAVEIDPKLVEARMGDIPFLDRIRVSQIYFKTKPNQDDPAKLRVARRVLRQLKNGQSFQALATQHSEDDSAATGGDMGWVQRGTQDADWEKVAFSLPADTLSDVFQTPFGYHIVKVTQKPGSADEARRMVAESHVRQEEAARVAGQRAAALLEKLKEGADLEAVAEEEGLKVSKSPLFGEGDALTRPRVQSAFNTQVFDAQKDDFLEPYLSVANYVVARVDRVVAARAPELEAVKGKVEEDYVEVRKIELNRERADALFESAKKEGLDAAASAADLRPTVTAFFKTGDTVDDVVRFSPMLHERVPFMQPGDVSPPFSVAGTLIVFEMVEKSEVDDEIFQQREEEIRQTLTSARQSSIFGGYVRNLVDEFRNNDQIRINQELLDDFKIN